jgi:hypothetical protein
VDDHSDVDNFWSVEVSIPFADLPGQNPKSGESWKLNVYRFDKARDKEGKPGKGQVAWSWAQPRGSFHNVENFGTLRFLKSGDIRSTKGVLNPRDLDKLPKAPKVDKPAAGVEPDKPD